MTADFLIIGGGIAGLSAAARLAPHGSVTLLEAEEALGYHASGRSAAMYLADYGNDTVRALNLASLDHHNSVGGGILSQRNMLMLARADERDDFIAEHTGFGMQEISVMDARAMLPIINPKTCAYVAHRSDVFDLDADRLLQDFTRLARKAGAKIHTRSRVDRIEKTKSGWLVHTGEASHCSRILINASGAWADGIAGLASVKPLGFQPYRRSMARLPAPAGHDVSDWPFIDGVNERWYAKPDAGKWLVSPSEEQPVEAHDAWADDMVLAEGLARYEEMVTEPVSRLETSWAGLRTFAPDRTLVIGADTQEPAFFWLAGQGGYGFQTAPAASQLLADLVTGSHSELEPGTINALSPARFDA